MTKRKEKAARMMFRALVEQLKHKYDWWPEETQKAMGDIYDREVKAVKAWKDACLKNR